MFLLAELEREAKMIQFDVCQRLLTKISIVVATATVLQSKKQNFQFWKHLVAVLVFAST